MLKWVKTTTYLNNQNELSASIVARTLRQDDISDVEEA